MLRDPSAAFKKMDELSLKKVPFFFMIDFLAENAEVFTLDELDTQPVFVSFPNFSNAKPDSDLNKEVYLQSFPPTLEDYQQGFDKVQRELARGNSYLVNYTCKTEIKTNLTPEEIFQHSKAKYKIWVPGRFVCFSPETFIEIQGNHIFTHPMKGTIDASFENAPEILKNDPKEKAEHYTVVDLLRNDLSTVADQVKVDEFQRIDYIRTGQNNLYAMSSEISGIVKPEFQRKTGSIMQRLLPAGSILGAPKTKTLEIILSSENYSRNFYTGVAGWFDGENLDSCVMIRFIEEENGKLYFKSGGGITHLSKLADEYQEMKNKIYVPIH